MVTISNRAVLILSLLVSMTVWAQERDKPIPATDSADQLIAETIWSLVDLETMEPQNPQAAFENAVRAYPESAEVAYWRGRLGAYTADRDRITRQISETLKKLAESQADDSEIADPDLKRKMRSVRSYAKVIGERIQQRANDDSNADIVRSPEECFLNAVSLDPSLIAAWARLAASTDLEIAVAAIDAWAEQEPDNALPFYAKAIVLMRTGNQSDPLDLAVIEALEEGNKRSDCRVPEEPWPVDFRLSFPQSLPEDAAELAGKPISPYMWRSMIENLFSQLLAIDGGTTVSESSLRGLGSVILQHSHQLSPQEDVRYLRAFVGVGLHLIDSNRLIFGGTAAAVERVLHRLENIAVVQGDFQHADELSNIEKHVRSVQRQVFDEYRAAEMGEDPGRNDREATKIMAANRKELTVPSIQFARSAEPIMVISDADEAGENGWVLMNLCLSDDRDVMVRPSHHQPPDPIPDADALSDLGYHTLDQAINRVRKSNLQNRDRKGIFLVVDQPYLETDIAGECFTKGYVGRRDSCIVAFTERESLESFRDIHYTNVRVAQILSPDGDLDNEQIDMVSPKADLLVVPLASLLAPDGGVLSTVKLSERRFVVMGAAQEKLMHAATRVPSIVGVVVSKLSTR
ncbi:hypothetical protein [Allorhodopirellula heiligendammensis]|uniref:Uncharacterized protein n=1 Tax=Allorhodopirellula heiligendammensis TaxID=2714739 RepID=A0A5C6BZ10_9BACT|nr:hypothetical protein [Allorhodopirellula heiligendammensis]TWU16927.1 hypothetical protein Poly21_41350 [Allorhodopirellula heiligendammensis]